MTTRTFAEGARACEKLVWLAALSVDGSRHRHAAPKEANVSRAADLLGLTPGELASILDQTES